MALAENLDLLAPHLCQRSTWTYSRESGYLLFPQNPIPDLPPANLTPESGWTWDLDANVAHHLRQQSYLLLQHRSPTKISCRAASTFPLGFLFTPALVLVPLAPCHFNLDASAPSFPLHLSYIIPLGSFLFSPSLHYSSWFLLSTSVIFSCHLVAFCYFWCLLPLSLVTCYLLSSRAFVVLPPPLMPLPVLIFFPHPFPVLFCVLFKSPESTKGLRGKPNSSLVVFHQQPLLKHFSTWWEKQ